MKSLREAVRSTVLDGTLQRKLLVSFVGIAVLAAAVGVVGVVGVTQVSATSDQIADDSVPRIDGAMTLRLAAQTERAAVSDVIRGDESAREDFNAAYRNFLDVQARLAERDDLSEEEAQLLAQIKQTHESLSGAAVMAMDGQERGNTELRDESLETYDAEQKELETLLSEYESLAKEEMQTSVAESNQTQQQSTAGIALLTLVAFGLALVVGRRVGTSVGSDIERVSEVATRIAGGEIDIDLEESDRGDEIDDLVTAFGEMQAYLRTVRDQARAVADQEFDAAVLDEAVPGVLGEAMTQLATDIEQAQREAEQARENVEAINESLVGTAAEYSECMDAAAEGDLTQRLDPDEDSEAMAEIATSFNAMMDDIERTLERISEFTVEVADSTRSVDATTDEIQAAGQQVEAAVREIADRADTQDENLDEINGEMQQLSGSIEEIASSADEVATTVQSATDRGREGRAAGEEAVEEMETIRTTADRTIDEVDQLATEMDQIGEIVEFITDIAEQTNMLALNASIEAARAGEAGEGFAVVADEIKGLAGEVNEATDEIEALIGDVQDSTTDAVEDMQTLGERVDEGTATIEDALDALDEVVDQVEDANASVREISDATDDQAASTEEVVSMIDEVSRLSAQTTGEASEAAEATQEQAASLSEVSQRAGALTGRTDELQDLLGTFTIDAAGGPSVDTDGSDAPAISDGGTGRDE
jgi:methyl-accepting chemotaxis protein